MRKSIIFTMIILLAVGAEVGVFASPRGTIRSAVATFSHESTDPIFFDSDWAYLLYDSLIRQDNKGDYQPSLAESWKIAADGNTWIFKIKKGLTFSNGDPLTAEDVAWSLERFSSETSSNPWSPYLRKNKDTITALDEYTVVYKTNTPEPPLISALERAWILPKKYFESMGENEFRKRPIGSGPWKLSKLISKTRVEFLANESYWGHVPEFAKYVEFMVPEESTRVAMLKRGDVDIATNMSMDRAVEMGNAGYRLQEVGAPSLFNISFQGSWYKEAGPIYDKRFRQAMSYAINRQELCDTYYQGYCKPGGRWFMYEKTWGWDPDWKPDPYDPERVKELLNEINYPKAFSNPVAQIYVKAVDADAIQALAGYWEDVGIQVKINVVDGTGYANFLFKRLKDEKAANVGAIIPWNGAGTLYNVYHSSNMFRPTGIHSTSNDETADKMYVEAASEIDPVLAKKKWTAFCNYAYDMWVNVGLVQLPTYVIVGPKMGEFSDMTHSEYWATIQYILHP